jgi:hypothetical protein
MQFVEFVILLAVLIWIGASLNTRWPETSKKIGWKYTVVPIGSITSADLTNPTLNIGSTS